MKPGKKPSELSEFGVLLRDVVRQLVDHPNEVGVNEIEGELVTILEISARKVDVTVPTSACMSPFAGF